MNQSGAGRLGCRARPRVGPFGGSGATEGTASHKVRPYNESFDALIGLGSGSIRVHPWFNGCFEAHSGPRGRRPTLYGTS